jgi:hypothetical protein
MKCVAYKALRKSVGTTEALLDCASGKTNEEKGWRRSKKVHQ